MGTWSVSHWLILLLIVLLLFGAGKIPQLMGDMAKGIKTFKKGMQDDEDTAKAPDGSSPPPRRSRSSTRPVRSRHARGQKAV